MRWASGEKARARPPARPSRPRACCPAPIRWRCPSHRPALPGMRRERITISLVRVMPTIFCRRAEPPEPGICPSFCSGRAQKPGLGYDAESHRRATARSRRRRQNPRLAAITGFEQRAGAAMFQASLETALRRCLHEALDVAAGRKMLADRAQHDDAHPRILVEMLEHHPQLVALRHRHHVQRRPVEDDVGPLARLDRSRRGSRRAWRGGDRRRGRVIEPDG